MSDSPNPIQVQKYLGGIDYPASKADIVEKATSAGADSDIIDALNGIADREYDGPTAVSQEISK